mmetsp:Transcript_8066/g.10701  ORF Transcript_8066/g.10701 Transcript_8066/m.10701 type:complete len:781 (-) Transcript_8066:306-2648(-)
MKRSLSAISDSSDTPRSARARTDSNSDTEEPNGFFLKHQNKALARELHSYKRRIKELEEKLSRQCERQRMYDATLSCINRSWTQLDSDLNMSLAAVTRKAADKDVEDSTTEDKNSLLARLLKSGIDYSIVDVTYHPALNGNLGKDDFGEKGNAQSKALRRVEEGLQKRCAFTHNVLKKVLLALQEARNQEGGMEAFHGDLMASKRKLKAKCLTLKDQLLQAHTRCQELDEELKNSRAERRKIYRKLDHLRSEGANVDDDLTSLSSEVNAKDKEGPNDDNQVTSVEYEMMKEEKEEQEELSQRRLKEIESIRNQKVELEKRITELIAELNSKNQSGESDRTLGLKLEKISEQLELEKEATNNERARRLDLERACAEMATELRGLETLIEEETTHDRKRWEARLQESTMALQAAQMEADHLRYKVEQCSESARRSNTYKSQVEEYKVLHKSMQAQVSRLKLDQARSKKQIERERAENRRRVGRHEVEELKRLGAKEKEQRILSLQDELKRTKLELDDAKSMNEGLIMEVESLSATFEDLTSQSSRLLAQIGEKEDATAKLMSEHLKLQQQLSGPAREEQSRSEQRARASELAQRLHESLAEKAMEREKFLEQRISAIEEEKKQIFEEAQLATRSAQAEKDLNVELDKKYHQALETANGLRSRCDELSLALDQAEAAKRRSEEESELAQRRVDKASQRLNKLQTSQLVKQEPDDFLLQEEVKELKKMLKCSVCHDRQKNVVISKCFHMFCKECVQENLKVRSRKCPACGRGFGQDDVHNIWLT